jgi:chromosome partitioning protein
MTRLALEAADHVVMPVQCALASMKGVERTLELVRELIERYDLDMTILRTMYASGTNIHAEGARQIAELYPERTLDVMIKRAIIFDEAMSAGIPVVAAAPDTAAAKSYVDAARELEARRLARSSEATGTPVTIGAGESSGGAR